MGVHLLTGGDESVLRDEVSDLVGRFPAYGRQEVLA